MSEGNTDFTRRLVLTLAFIMLILAPILTVYLPYQSEHRKLVPYNNALKERVEKEGLKNKKLEDIKIGLEKADPFVLETFVRQTLRYSRPDEIVVAEESNEDWSLAPTEKLDPLPQLKNETRPTAPKNTKAFSFIVYVSLVVVAYLVLFREKRGNSSGV